MGPHSRPLLGDVLPSFGSIEKRVVSDWERKTTFNCDGGDACLQPSERKPSYSFSIRRLSVAFVSLAIIYSLVSCFNFTRDKSRVAVVSRSLATGGGRPCHEYEEDRESKDDEEDAGMEAFWAEGLAGTLGERPEEEASFATSIWNPEETQWWPSLPTTTGIANLGRIRRHHSGTGLDGTALAQEFQAAHLHDASPRGSPPAEEQIDRAIEGWDHKGRPGMSSAGKLPAGETYDMWERRAVPEYVEGKLVNLFQRITSAAKVCQYLLPGLTQSHRLRLTREVVRLLALQLGALSLVPERLEPLRQGLGDALLQLSNEALRRGGKDEKLDEHRSSICDLVALVEKLKQPRPLSEKNSASSYRVKMISLLITVPEVVGLCLSSLEGLSKFSTNRKDKRPSDVVTQHINILWKVFDVFSLYIARDATLRFFILDSQKAIGRQPILSHRHAQVYALSIPSMKQVVKEIHEAVRSAGGLPQFPSQPAGQLMGVSHTPSTTDQQTPSHGPMGRDWRYTQSQGGLHPPSQPLPPPRVSAPAGLHNMQAASVATPLLRTSLVLTRGGHPAVPRSSLQPGYETRNTEKQLQHFPSQPPQPVLGSSMPSMRPTPHSLPPALVHQTPRIPGMAPFTGMAPTGAPRHDSLGFPSLRHLDVWQDSASVPQYRLQASSSAPVGTPAHVGVPVYPMHRGYTASGQEIRHAGFPVASRPTEQASGGASGRNYETIQASTPQYQTTQEVEEIEGLLGDLLKGGLRIEDVFPQRKSPDQ